MHKNRAAFASFAALTSVFASGPAAAQEGLEIKGAPVDGLMGFQPPATSIATDTQALDQMVLVIITAICALVFALIAWVIVRHNRRANPQPRSFTHNTVLEIAWTLGPVIILVVIGSFSLPVLFKQQVIPEGDVVINVTGNQWYWSYEYPDEGFGFDSYLIGHPATLEDSDYEAGARDYVLNDAMVAVLERYGYSRDEFLLATDNAVVVPTGKVVVMNLTGSDVIHSWTIPAFGVKQDAVPGRTAQLWFEVDEGKEGIYFGQCSELCGKDHAYMPITVKAVTQEEYEAWLKGAREQFAEAAPAAPALPYAPSAPAAQVVQVAER